MNLYQFERIVTRMKKQHGGIPAREEHAYQPMLYAMEANLMMTYTAYPSCNARRVMEAISLVLFHIDGFLSGKPQDTSDFENEDNLRLKHALLMAFDPYTNKTIDMKMLKEAGWDMEAGEDRKLFYHNAIVCLLKIHNSAGFWLKDSGPEAYFAFISGFLPKARRKIESDEDYEFFFMARTDMV